MKRLNRDPFSRSTTVRKTADPELLECAWCGASRRIADVAIGRRVTNLYQYGYLSDASGRARYVPKAFCGIDCARAYGVEA